MATNKVDLKIDSLKFLYETPLKTEVKTNAQLLEEYLKENAINSNHSDIEKLKERLRFKPLLLEKSLVGNKDKKKRIGKRKNTKLGRVAIKKLNLYKISKDEQKYDTFLPLHNLWKNYVRNLYLHKNGKVMIRAEERVLKIDYHGAKIEVKKCKCESFVGISGIIVKETKNMFEIITQQNELKALPKRETLFEFLIHGHKISIYGNAIVGRPGERMVKRFKNTYESDMILDNL
ncbi:ribonuclease P protein subunit p29-like [Clytia hemisphaerica]